MNRRFILTSLLLVALPNHLPAAENMIGRQSQNEGILAVPAPGPVTIDGDLSDWDWSGRIWVFADAAVRDRYSVEVAAMWDKEYLYMAAKWKAPLPMWSTVDPDTNPHDGWKSDSWQMRVATPDRTQWITTWYFTPKQQPLMDVTVWKEQRNSRGPMDIRLLRAAPGGTDLGDGVALAYRKDADGKGFSQEVRIPWRLIYATVPEIKPGVVFRLGNEFLWGDETGKTWPVHRYADNMQPGKTGREFYFLGTDSWGDLKLVEKGHVPVREYIADTERITGTVPVRANIPQEATRFTVVLDDADGHRVRTLAADCEPADYPMMKGVGPGHSRPVEVLWDCLDDKGKLVAPGTYRIQGLTQNGVSASYEMCYYNPGTPPWDTTDGRGGWGADHSAPIGVAAGADWTFVTWPIVEGGCGLIGIDPTGQKRWSDKRGTVLVTADDQCVYGYVKWWTTTNTICRYALKTGVTQPVVRDGQTRPFDLPLAEIFDEENPGTATGLAAQGGRLVVARSIGKLAVLDATSAAVIKQFDVADAGAVAFSREGQLYGLVAGKLNRINLETGALAPVNTPGLGKPVSLAVDGTGNLVVSDGGPDCQVKAFTPAGQLAYTCGKQGGRPIRGAFDEQAMSHMSSVAVDRQDRVWVVENWNYPRRVSVWGRDGKLVRDYLGNTGYAGADCYLAEDDPTLAYCGPMEFKLDKAQRTWKLTQVLWVPDKEQGESFQIETHSNVIPQRFSRVIEGHRYEYFYSHEYYVEGTGHVVFMDRAGHWQPVAALCLVGQASGRLAHHGIVLEPPTGELAGLNPYDILIWNDTNHDGKIQRGECTVIPAKKPGTATQRGEAAFSLAHGWGGRLGDDLSIYTDGPTRWKPLRYDAGAPVYGVEGKTALQFQEPGGDLAPVPGTDQLIDLGWYGKPPALTMVNLKTGTTEWSYPNPYPGVHGSHNATMPKPGLLIGPLKTAGIAHVNDTVGNVFLMRGNLGQDFLFTTDGLYVGALFQDCRLPGAAMPENENLLAGMPLEGFSEGGEPFNGWFGKQADGKIRLTTAFARNAGTILEIKGLDTIHRFDAGTFTVDQATIVKADQDNSRRVKAATQPKQYTIVAGMPGKWKDVPVLTIARTGQPERATVKLMHDAANLYAQFQVDDMSPWRNEGKEFARLFKTGDAVDIQLGAPVGDLRIVIAPLAGQPAAVLMMPVDKTAPATAKRSYTSPVGTKVFDRVEILTNVTITAKAEGTGYRVEATIPLAVLGLPAQAGFKLRGDVGFISSDVQGRINVARTYWANPFTNLVNDEPMEAWLNPTTWGNLVFE